MEPILNLCAEIEQTAGKIYRLLAERTSFQPQLRGTLQEMARDEDDHARIIQLAKRLDSDKTIRHLHVTKAHAAQLLNESREILLSVGSEKWPEDYTVRTLLAMEDRLRQVHISCSAEFTDQSLQDMFAKLGKEDEKHVSALRAYL